MEQDHPKLSRCCHGLMKSLARRHPRKTRLTIKNTPESTDSTKISAVNNGSTSPKLLPERSQSVPLLVASAPYVCPPASKRTDARAPLKTANLASEEQTFVDKCVGSLKNATKLTKEHTKPIDAVDEAMPCGDNKGDESPRHRRARTTTTSSPGATVHLELERLQSLPKCEQRPESAATPGKSPAQLIDAAHEGSERVEQCKQRSGITTKPTKRKRKERKRKPKLFMCHQPLCLNIESEPCEFKVCGYCTARYCSQSCAASDWRRHKKWECPGKIKTTIRNPSEHTPQNPQLLSG